MIILTSGSFYGPLMAMTRSKHDCHKLTNRLIVRIGNDNTFVLLLSLFLFLFFFFFFSFLLNSTQVNIDLGQKCVCMCVFVTQIQKVKANIFPHIEKKSLLFKHKKRKKEFIRI